LSIVTAVGGTQLAVNDSETAEEALFLKLNGNIVSSGGGFSNVFGVPTYQREAVSGFLAKSDIFDNTTLKVSTNGRGVPDISALSRNYVTQINGNLETVHGTSAAAPTVASMVVLINDMRLREGKSVAGFLNPVLYAHNWTLKDIYAGKNFDCNGKDGFKASLGWDAVTGLGSPDFEKLLTVYKNLD
jgi:tripeptidyl-peptidase I